MNVRSILPFALILLAGCGSAPARPTSPTPSRVTLAGTITDTSTGAPVGSFVQDVNGLPAFVTVTADGFLTRQTWVSSATPSVDLIRDAAPFDLTFYRQMVRGSLDGPVQPIRRLTASPSIYLQTAGLSASTVAALEAAARAVVPALTGGQLTVAGWETGANARTERAGWIVVELIADEAAHCGRAFVGALAGHVWLNTVPKCHRGGAIISGPGVFGHEIGHAIGFWHSTAGLMQTPTAFTATPSSQERHHAAIAYKRPIGSTDVDVDPRTSGISSAQVVVD